MHQLSNQALTAVIALCLVGLLWLMPPPARAAGCAPECISTHSVVHAAGTPPDFLQAARRLRFDGDVLAAGDARVVDEMAKALKALPSGTVLNLGVAADSGLSASAARKQASARAKALSKALVAAGVPAAQLKVSAAV